MKNSFGVGIILINGRKEVLLILRDDKPDIPFPDMWDLPGGHPKEGEEPEDCIRREMMEEMELDLGEIRFFRKYCWPDFDEYIFWKHVDLDLSEIVLHEGQRLAYFGCEDIKTQKLAFYYNQVLPEFYEKNL